VSCSVPGAARPQTPMTKSTLKMAEPTMAAMPTSLGSGRMEPTREVKNSGAEPPAAMKVAPATSGERPSAFDMQSSEGTKSSSQTRKRAMKV